MQDEVLLLTINNWSGQYEFMISHYEFMRLVTGMQMFHVWQTVRF